MRPALWWLIPLTIGACAAPLDVDGGRARQRVVQQVEMGPRIPGTAGHRTIVEWLDRELTRLGGKVEHQVFTDSTLGRPLRVENLIARFGPGQGRRVALCAHYDTRPWCDQDPDSARRREPLPGANDGASGVAVLLEVAELLSRRQPSIGVDLVFFDAEDQGVASRPAEFCIGSRGYAARLSGPGHPSRPVAAFVFDMVGDLDLGIHPEIGSAQRAANLVALVLEGARATGARGFRSEPRYTLADDHVPLLDRGLPAVDVIDFDYPAWHTHLDRPDRVSASSLAEVSRVAAWLVYRSGLARP